MAKSTKKPKKAKPVARRAQTSRAEIEEAADIASREAVEELGMDFSDDGLDDDTATEGLLAQPDESYAEDDVFEESFKKAVALNTAPRFHIKKNSQFLAVKGWPYSWEKLQAEFGEGYYQVIAKAQHNGQILRKQSEMVGDPSGGTAPVDDSAEEVQGSDSNMAYLAMMNQFQERADAKAKENAKTGENAMAVVMQTVMQTQQQNTQLMMQMMQESNKQFQSLLMSMQNKGPDPMLALVTTLLTQKPVSDGMKPHELLKIVEDAKRGAKDDERRNYEFMEKKADQLAEIKVQAMEAGGEEAEEGGLKGLIKGFVPVITQMIANNQAGPAAQIQEQRRLMGADRALDQGFVDEQANRPMVAAPRPQVRPRPQVVPAPVSAPAPVVQRVEPPAVVPDQVVQQPVSVQSAAPKVETSVPAQELILNDRQKRQVFDACAGDIGRALMDRVPASKTAKEMVEKLEKEGLSRQTVAKAYTLEDFYGYAAEYGLPEEVKPWLKDFHESIQKMASPNPVRSANPSSLNGHGPKPGLSAKRAAPVGAAARAQSRSNPKDI